MPLDWAGTQANLARAEIILFDRTADPAHLDRAEARLQEALEVFAVAGASHYADMARRNFALVSLLRAPPASDPKD